MVSGTMPIIVPIFGVDIMNRFSAVCSFCVPKTVLLCCSSIIFRLLTLFLTDYLFVAR